MRLKSFFLFPILVMTYNMSMGQAMGNRYDSARQGYTITDTLFVTAKRMPQHSEFLNGTYDFPAKPRNQWEIGVKGGLFQVSGDIPAKFFSPGFGIHIRKALGYIFSLRMEYIYGIGKGQAWRYTENYAKNSAWGANITDVTQRYSAPKAITVISGEQQIVSSQTGLPTTPFDHVYYNFKTVVQDLSLEGLITLHNIRFHRKKTGWNIYGFAGVGGSIYDTKVNALNGAIKYTAFNSLSQSTYKNRHDQLKALKTIMDDSYETPAENHGERRPKLFGDTFKPSATVGTGLAFRINKHINLSLENRWTFIKDDLLDGQRWQEQSWGDAVLTRDFDSYNYTSLGLNFNIGHKSTEPLWWINPLEYAYQEIRKPILMRFPTSCIIDSDGDGIDDRYDMEQTPAGCPVDSHGVSVDTDGDGVPDCKDQQLITPTRCQPSDAKGVGRCPCACP